MVDRLAQFFCARSISKVPAANPSHVEDGASFWDVIHYIVHVFEKQVAVLDSCEAEEREACEGAADVFGDPGFAHGTSRDQDAVAIGVGKDFFGGGAIEGGAIVYATAIRKTQK